MTRTAAVLALLAVSCGTERGASPCDLSALGAPLRSHGGRHEQPIPLLLSEPPAPAGLALLAAGATNADVHHLLIGAGG